MDKKLPRTPFSTGLSRSAKETEIRIRNIFSGPKKRPPVLLFALMCAVALSCGDLVSCQMREEVPDAPPADISSLPDPPERQPEAKVWEDQAVLGDQIGRAHV